MSCRRFVVVLGICAAAAASLPLVAGPALPAESPDAVRALWDALRAVRVELRDAQHQRDTKRVRALRPKEDEAEAAFTHGFAAAAWTGFDPAKDADLLDAGFRLAGSDALARDDAAGAQRAFEAYLKILPEGESAALVEGVLLPEALIAAHDVDRAQSLAERHAHALVSPAQGPALVLLGDLLAARRGTAEARAEWNKVEAVPAEKAGRSRIDAAHRLALVGREAPEIDTKSWLGAEAKPLSALRGGVVLLDFWATWSQSCRRAQGRLEQLHRTRAKDGLTVVGVTRFFDYGYVPPEGAPENETDGDRLAGMSGVDFAEHLQSYRKNLTLTYPFAVADKAHFDAYEAKNIPTTVLVDRQGEIAFVQVGGGDDTLLRLALDRLLAPEPAEPPK